jgi:hypothetical protein
VVAFEGGSRATSGKGVATQLAAILFYLFIYLLKKKESKKSIF